MKKILFSMLAVFMLAFSMNNVANAQTVAYKNAPLGDNVYIGIGVGATTALDFNSVMPLNTTADLRIGKELTPVTSFELEGTALFGDNHYGDYKTYVKATNVGVNALFNIGNLFGRYKNRRVEYKAVAGLGWLHVYDNDLDALTAKTGMDVVFNLGRTQKFAIVLEPTVYWNLNKEFDGTEWRSANLEFNKNRAQLGLNVNFVYRFKNSGGSRRIVAYDIDALYAEIDDLRSNTTTVYDTVVKEVLKEVEVTRTVAGPTVSLDTPVYVLFAQNSYTLTDDAKKTLDNIATQVAKETEIEVNGYASPEGESGYNIKLSLDRAQAVADYLTAHGMTVKTVRGCGVAYGDATNRVVTVSAIK